MGWTCCYRKELISAVQAEHSWKSTQYMLRESQRKSRYTLVEQHTNGQLYTFAALQILDIYTTYRGLKYDCVYEMNPVVGERPSVGKMVTTKIAILYPTIVAEQQRYYVDRKAMSDINFLMTLVILNNIDVVQGAKKNCVKRP